MQGKTSVGIALAAALVRSVRQAYTRKWSFLGFFLLAFVVSVWVLAALDLLPNPPAENTPEVGVERAEETLPSEPLAAAEPVRIEVPALNLSSLVLNPSSAAVADLDRELLSGAVRHPASARLGEEGNVILFGHSSYLPFVNNAAYKVFNDIQKLKVGDLIHVYSEAAVYVYHVRSVEKENADTGAIPLAVEGKVLTLATCNSFGAKEDRFVVTADFVESYPAAS